MYCDGFYLEVFQLDLQVPFMVCVLLSQEDGMAVVARLSENLDGYLHIKVDLALTALFNIRSIWQPLMI